MSSRRLAGMALLLSGGALLAYAGSGYAVGSWRRAQAFQAWEAAEARLAVSSALASASASGAPVTLVRGAPMARLVIPKIGLDEVVLEGVTERELVAAPGHLPGSAFPGEAGNSVISAHRDRHFDRLGELRVGDTVTVDAGLVEQRWIVSSRRIVHREAPALFHTSDATLTLTTCWPIRYFGTAPERLILTAKLLPASSFAVHR